MDTVSNPVDSRKSFFNRAAWCSFLIPLVTAAITFVLISEQAHKLITDNTFVLYLICAFCFQVISLILALWSLFGIPRHGAKLILWKAALGILASCGMGIVIFLLVLVAGMAHGD